MKCKMKGFTLLEMAIVVLLIGILGMVAIPSMKMIYKQEAKKAADSLCLDLVSIRKQARITGSIYTLELNEPTGSHQSEYTLALEEKSKTIETGNNANIAYKIKDRADRKIIFEGRAMKDATGVEQTELIIVVSYAGEDYIEITFDNLTGNYTMTRMK